MAEKKVVWPTVVTTDKEYDGYRKVWISRDIAKDLDFTPNNAEWIYLRRDRMGVLSTQALVYGVLDEDGCKVECSKDVMETAHFQEGWKIKAWKVTDWE